jgi:hypothetical protein
MITFYEVSKIFLGALLFLPWIILSLMPIWAPLLISIIIFGKSSKFIYLKINFILSKKKSFSKFKIHYLILKYMYQFRLAEGVDIQIYEKKNGDIIFIVRLLTSGLRWGFKIKAHNYQDALIKLHLKFKRLSMKTKFEINNLRKLQIVISKSCLFSANNSANAEVHIGCPVLKSA